MALYNGILIDSTIEKGMWPGAPLRNRTVDLLLTMGNQHLPVTAIEPLTCPDAGSHELTQAAASAR
jgi:hypothetical protein